MTEDILEQLVEGWFKRRPSTFTKHNIKYRPDISQMEIVDKRKYCVHSDIDVIAVDLYNGNSVVTCKSWQGGLDVNWWFDRLSDPNRHNERSSGREIWKSFRELTNETWAEAFRDKVYSETNSRDFTYYIAVTKLINQNNIEQFTNCDLFLNNLKGNENQDAQINIEFLTLENMITAIFNELQNTALEATEIGRFIQLIKAANMTIRVNEE